MNKLFAALLITSTAFATSAAEIPRQEMLKRIYDMRMRLDRDRQQAENEARANVGLIRPQSVDAPTVSQMRREMGASLAQISNNYRCLDVDVENNGGNTVVVCGSNNGMINGENTTAAGDIVGAINTLQGAMQSGADIRGAMGAAGSVLIGPLGNPVTNSGTYIESNTNTASNNALVKGDVKAPLVQSNTQANGDIGDRTAVVRN